MAKSYFEQLEDAISERNWKKVEKIYEGMTGKKVESLGRDNVRMVEEEEDALPSSLLFGWSASTTALLSDDLRSAGVFALPLRTSSRTPSTTRRAARGPKSEAWRCYFLVLVSVEVRERRERVRARETVSKRQEQQQQQKTHDQRLLELLERVLAVLQSPVGEELVDDLIVVFWFLVMREGER